MPNIYQKILSVMNDAPGVVKGATIEVTQSRSYTAVNHDDVTALIRPLLIKHGLVAIPTITSSLTTTYSNEKEYQGKITKSNGYRTDLEVDVAFINVENPDEKHIVHSTAYALDSGDKGTGKAFSMAVKYAYLKTFNLESFDQEEERTYEQWQQPQKHVIKSADTTKHKPNISPGKPASEAQKKAIYAIAKSINVTPREVATSQEASDEIKRLNSL